MSHGARSTFPRHIESTRAGREILEYEDYDSTTDEEGNEEYQLERQLRRRARKDAVPDYESLGRTVRQEMDAEGLGRSAGRRVPGMRPAESANYGNYGGNKPGIRKNSTLGDTRKTTYNLLLIVGSVIFVLCGLLYVYKLYNDTPSQAESYYVDPKFEKQWHKQNVGHMLIIGKDFPSQTKTIWIDFFSGVKKVLVEKPSEPSIFLLLHHENEMTTKCLAEKVAAVARDMMNVTQRGLLVVDGRTLVTDGMDDRGRFVTKYKPLVEQHRVMIVNNLETIPADVAQSLHAFCDTVTPFVDKAIYIFTLNVDKVSWDGIGNPTHLAERELNDAWNNLDNDIRQPLIIRITGGHVHKINPETDSKQC